MKINVLQSNNAAMKPCNGYTKNHHRHTQQQHNM
ncbi:hypothetical protein T10_9986 [Trichinella papuae]|uniref:Uncharacterized protein n=1 Tax=Trichinella papuae TaxID=268474 RepID=A0A0V1LZW4_9BILA|nr:hypothetical protein T10_9986 [Trichinella papuae]